MQKDERSEFDSLLQTKLFAPAPQSGLVTRSHLLDRLSSSLREGQRFKRKLTLIAAPAGYGKTTLASSWLHALDIPVAWLSLEDGDNDPTRFIRYLTGALQMISSDLGRQAQAMLRSPQRPPDEIVLTTLINDLTSRDDLLILVLDDYHLIHTPGIHKALNFLVEHIPQSVHIVLATREDPPIAIPRLQARDQALVIRQADLAFNQDEATEFFHHQAAIELSPDEAAALTRRTEGWVTGLQLAALSVLDYLFEEVLDQQSSDLQAFLLKTSVLERFCSELCDAVLLGEESQAAIEDLERMNFFIVPLDQSRRWYRFHRLFGDLLRHRLRTSKIDDVDQLHLRASRWFEGHGYPAEAIDHALAAQDWERGANLIVQEEDALLRNGEVRTLLHWCEKLPESTRLEQPALALAYAWPLILIGELDRASPVLQAAGRRAGESQRLQGEIASAEAFIARARGDMPLTIELSNKALALLPEEDRGARGNISVNLGIITWHLGQLAETEHLMREGMADSLAVDNKYSAHTAQVFLARTLASQGQLREAKELLSKALEAGDRVPTAVIAHLDVAALSFEWNDLSRSFEHLERASRIAGALHNLEFQVACLVQRALAQVNLAELDAASEALKESDTLVKDEDLPLLTRARRAACRIQYAIAGGDLEAARRLLEAMPVEQDAHSFNRFIDLNTARLRQAEGKFDQARDLLVKAYKQAERSGWRYASLAVRVLQSLAAESEGSALEFLRNALQRAEPEGYIRLFLNEGERLVPLLRESARGGVAPEYVGAILSAYGKARKISSTKLAGLVEPLTERELEVLRLVAAGLSNRQISEQLVVSLGTVKSHIHHVFGKLGVESRTKATVRAQELGLI
jgi:LuxR family maltose regulon positive regulatory protein